jgi:hypothetical protein
MLREKQSFSSSDAVITNIVDLGVRVREGKKKHQELVETIHMLLNPFVHGKRTQLPMREGLFRNLSNRLRQPIVYPVVYALSVMAKK